MEKIVFVLGNYKNGGMAVRATNLANEFANHGYAVDILVTKELRNDYYFTNRNVNIISIEEYNNNHDFRKYSGAFEKRYQYIRRIKFIRKFTKLFKKFDKKLEKRIKSIRKGFELLAYCLKTQPDIVIPLGLTYLEPVISATAGLNCKIVYAEKNAPELEFPQKGSEDYYYYTQLLQQVHGVIVQTEVEKEFFGDDLNNIIVINNPIKPELPLPYKGKRNKIIVNFCRMSRQKNLDLLIEAFAKINFDFPDYILNIYGNTVNQSELEYKKHIIEKVNKMGLINSVFILPPSTDVHKKILNSAMFVSASDYEGLSNSMIEAMAIGLPCVCTDCLGGGTQEVMINKQNGLIVPMNNVDAMYRAMKCYIDNPNFAEYCGYNASKIREKLDVKRIAKQWIDVFRGEIIGGKIYKA